MFALTTNAPSAALFGRRLYAKERRCVSWFGSRDARACPIPSWDRVRCASTACACRCDPATASLNPSNAVAGRGSFESMAPDQVRPSSPELSRLACRGWGKRHSRVRSGGALFAAWGWRVGGRIPTRCRRWVTIVRAAHLELGFSGRHPRGCSRIGFRAPLSSPSTRCSIRGSAG